MVCTFDYRLLAFPVDDSFNTSISYIDCIFVHLSGENTASIDRKTPNTDLNSHRGILKNTPDENATELMENNKRKRGLFFNEIFLNEFSPPPRK